MTEMRGRNSETRVKERAPIVYLHIPVYRELMHLRCNSLLYVAFAEARKKERNKGEVEFE